MVSRRSGIIACVCILSLLLTYHSAGLVTVQSITKPLKEVLSSSPLKASPEPAENSKSTTNSGNPHDAVSTSGLLPPHIENYFDQVFSLEKPEPFDFSMLKDVCSRTKWAEDEVYLKCAGMAAGMTSIISQVKVCLKMAIDSGSNLLLPAMPLRDSKDLFEYNFMNGDAFMTYDRWFDVDHLKEALGRACPKMKIVHPDDLDKTVPVKNNWSISCSNAAGYKKFDSYFWVGRPFRTFFDDQYGKLVQMAEAAPDRNDTKTGITVVDIDTEFLLYRITDDPTRRDLKLWNDLSHLIRFTEGPRKITNRLLTRMSRPFYGVHFRVEKDAGGWSPLETQLNVDLDILDKAWETYGRPDQEKPIVYLACGDQEQVEKFVTAGADRGWEVTHKWKLTKDDPETTQMINDLAFDFQGAVDMGVMVRSQFFLGITGSAFSATVANQRDITGRYRGSSLLVFDDEGARSHLNSDTEASAYPCCL